jgi:hypothetical protein
VPDLVPSAVRNSDLRQPGFDTSALLASTAPAIEHPSRGRIEGNVTGGGERRIFRIPAEVEGLEANLFKNRADLKLLTSQVAMHLSSEERHRLFSAIDRLLNIAEWEDESSEIDENSFRSFLRFTIYARPRNIPNLGVSPDGALLAGWHAEEKSVHVEFLPNDQCMALMRLRSIRGPETIAWRGHVASLRDAIRNNGAIECLD